VCFFSLVIPGKSLCVLLYKVHEVNACGGRLGGGGMVSRVYPTVHRLVVSQKLLNGIYIIRRFPIGMK